MKRRTFLGYSLLFMVGCTATTNSSRVNENAPSLLKFAVTDILDADVLTQNYDPFRQELEKVLGIPIEFYPVSSFPEAAVALQTGNANFVLAGPSEYVIIHGRTNAVPVIAITRPNYLSVIAVASNSNIKSVQDLKGKTIAMSDIGATSGHLGPTKLLIDAGLQLKSDITVKMLGDQGSAVALQNGTVDAWGGSFIDYEKYLKSASTSSPVTFTILEQGPPLPSDIFLVSQQLDAQWIEQCKTRMVENQDTLIKALVMGEETQKYRGSELVPASDSDYDLIREVYQAIGQGDFLQ